MILPYAQEVAGSNPAPPIGPFHASQMQPSRSHGLRVTTRTARKIPRMGDGWTLPPSENAFEMRPRLFFAKKLRNVMLSVLAVGTLAAGAYAGTVGVVVRSPARETSAPPPLAIGGSGASDHIDGTAGADRVNAGAGDDRVSGGGGGDLISGGGGDDRIRGDAGNDRLSGGLGADVLYGGSGRDTLLGGPGNDTFYAADGDRDLVVGGAGFDRAYVDRRDVVRGVERIYRP
jgi:hypothetical protein